MIVATRRRSVNGFGWRELVPDGKALPWQAPAVATPAETKTAIAAVFDRASGTYDAVGVDYFAAFGRRLVELVAPRPGERVLDTGCGRGAATFPAAEAVGPDGYVLGIDLAPGMVDRAAREAAARGLTNVAFRVGDAESPEVAAGEAFDVVLSAFVIFFLPDPELAMRNYRALLRDGGRFGLTTFRGQQEGPWKDVGTVLQRHAPGPAANRPPDGPLASPEAREAALRAAGFTAVAAYDETLETSFADLDQWWRWVWSQGQRAWLERVPPGELDGLRAEAYDVLRPACDADGTLRLRQDVTYTVATV